ncbi:hypothetical protein L596_006525 [Steinernema carpocapsae]|uniref:PAS domain-containing protein n=1 Tax=Steinernema carpocapsae TaxID=34508 RepID=A0A4V6I969_STECR|nr:hypothetical protein L596_006525 [Steinernema carpocapsae]
MSTAGGSSSGKNVAQYRRQMENAEFEHLSAQLPIARAISGQHIDKTSVVRLASTFMRLTQAMADVPKASKETSVDRFWNAQLLEVLDGFLMCLSATGDILYVSETISIHLGLSQVEMTGNSIFDYMHPSDSYIVRHTLETVLIGQFMSVLFRMRSTLTKRASKENPRSASGFRAVKMDLYKRSNEEAIFAFCQPQTQSCASTLRLDNYSFLISTEVNMSIRHVDARGEEVLGTTSGSLAQISFYQLIHPEDTARLTHLHMDLFQLGTSISCFCRLIRTNGQTKNQKRYFYADICGNRYPLQHNGKYVRDCFNFIIRPCE